MQDHLTERRPHRTDAKRGPKIRVASGIYQRAGRFIITFGDGTGKEVSKTLPKGTSLSKAKTERERLRVGVREGDLPIGDRKLTVQQLADSYVARERSVLGTHAKSTVDLRECLLRNHVVPLLGPKTRVADLRVQHIRRMKDRLVEKRLAGATIHACVSAASAMLKHAVVDLAAISRNPCRDLERGELPSAKRQTEPRYLSVPEVECLLSECSEETRPAVATMFWSGMRVSEACSLRWEDVDFEAKTILVPGTKTEASKATVPLLPALEAELRAHRERQGKRGFSRIQQDALCFATKSGKLKGRRNLLHAVNGAAKRAGLVQEGQEPVGNHDLRHSLAANAYAVGLSDLEVARTLRHANPQITRTVYAGITAEAETAIASKLAAIGGAS